MTKLEESIKKSRFWAWAATMKVFEPNIHGFVSAILALLTNVCIGLLSVQSVPRRVSIPLIVVFSLLFLIDLIIYSLVQLQKKKGLEQLQTILQEYEHKFSICQKKQYTVDKICGNLHVAAKNINELSRKIKREKVMDINLWSAAQTYDMICESIFDLISNKTNTDLRPFEVTIITFSEHERKLYWEMCSYKNDGSSMPSIYNKKTAFAEDPSQKYFFQKVYERNTLQPIVLLKPEDFSEFYYSQKSKKKNNKYKQYIGLPIYCDAKKLMGIVQIVSFSENFFGETENSVREDWLDTIQPFVSCLVLSSKVDKCIQTLVEVKNETKG